MPDDEAGGKKATRERERERTRAPCLPAHGNAKREKDAKRGKLARAIKKEDSELKKEEVRKKSACPR